MNSSLERSRKIRTAGVYVFFLIGSVIMIFLATLKGANPELVEMFNKGLENIKASGRYDEILNTYIAK